MLKLSVSFTSAVEVFVAHSGPKMSYTNKPLGNEFFVTSHSLLFERGIGTHDLSIHDWDGIPTFFKTGDNIPIPYDIFAASFFLISRYEESIHQSKKEVKLFNVVESLAFNEGILELPLVDLWAFKLNQIMSDHFIEIKSYNKISSEKEIIIDVPLAFKYRHRSFLVIIENFLKSILQFNLLKIFNQLMVLTRFKEDPYDSFDSWNIWFKAMKIKPKVFFLYSNSSIYESNVSIFNLGFQSRIKKAGDDYFLGLLISVQSQLNPDLYLNKEKKNFQELTHRQVKTSRIPRVFRQLPKVYADIVEFEFSEDYSMGYSEEIGFRAGTSTPFYFYDLTNEFQLPLKVHPVVASEKALRKGKTSIVFDTLDHIFKNLPLNCSRLTISISNGFLHSKKRNLPLQKAFKNFIK